MLGHELGQGLLELGELASQLGAPRLGLAPQRLVAQMLKLVGAIVDPVAQLAFDGPSPSARSR